METRAKVIRIIVLGILCACFVAAGFGLYLYRYAVTPTQSDQTSVVIWIESGQSFPETVAQLQEHESGLLAGNAHPYATYMTLKQSDNYTFEELTSALETLLDTDVRLKRSGQNPKLVLERAVLQICGT